MKGLELAKLYYEKYGKPMLEKEFPALLPHIAVGLVGAGSECLGFDDEVSRDHDFEPGFCIFLPDEERIDRATAFRLERAYHALPDEFEGYKRTLRAPTGGPRHGVLRIAEFLAEKTGTPDGNPDTRDFFFIPEQSLLELTGGALFYDGDGVFTALRARHAYLPEDVRRKKLAGELLLAGQAGQYNYPRMMERHDNAAGQLCLTEFVKSCLHIFCLLNKVYLPYYKWQFRTVSRLPLLSEFVPTLEWLITAPNDGENVQRKQEDIAKISTHLTSALHRLGLSQKQGMALEDHAYAVNDRIENGAIRNLHILYGV